MTRLPPTCRPLALLPGTGGALAATDPAAPIPPSLKPDPPEPASPSEGAADLLLVRAALSGDVQARGQLAERLANLPALVRARHHRMGMPLDPDALEDVTQNVLLALWRKLARFDGRSSLVGWALGFATYELLKETTRRHRRHEQQALPTELVDPHRGPSLDEDDELLHLLQRLPPAEVDLLRSKHLDGLSFREIADNLGSNIATIKTRYYRALQALRRRLPDPSGDGA